MITASVMFNGWMMYWRGAGTLPGWWFEPACLPGGVAAVSWPDTYYALLAFIGLGQLTILWMRLVGQFQGLIFCWFHFGSSIVWVLPLYLVFIVLRSLPRSGRL